MSGAVKPIPEGYPAVMPYLVVDHAERVIEFIKQAFGAREILSMKEPDGSVGHTELRIRDSVVMLGAARGEWKAVPSMLYLYVEDVDRVYDRAIAAGGVSMQAPKDQFYGDRTAGVRDPSGNQWFLATHTEDVSMDELHRRHRIARGAATGTAGASGA